MRKYICDRCKAEREFSFDTIEIPMNSGWPFSRNREYVELCNACKSGLRKVMLGFIGKVGGNE